MTTFTEMTQTEVPYIEKCISRKITAFSCPTPIAPYNTLSSGFAETLDETILYFKDSGVNHVALTPYYSGQECYLYIYKDRRYFFTDTFGRSISHCHIDKLVKSVEQIYSQLKMKENNDIYAIVKGTIVPFTFMGIYPMSYYYSAQIAPGEDYLRLSPTDSIPTVGIKQIKECEDLLIEFYHDYSTLSKENIVRNWGEECYYDFAPFVGKHISHIIGRDESDSTTKFVDEIKKCTPSFVPTKLVTKVSNDGSRFPTSIIEAVKAVNKINMASVLPLADDVIYSSMAMAGTYMNTAVSTINPCVGVYVHPLRMEEVPLPECLKVRDSRYVTLQDWDISYEDYKYDRDQLHSISVRTNQLSKSLLRFPPSRIDARGYRDLLSSVLIQSKKINNIHRILTI